VAETILIVPGLNGSGAEHWQTHWEALLPNAIRVAQTDWERPRRAPWVETLNDQIARHPGAILVAHSLGCALVANAVKDNPEIDVSAAMLVSPSDIDWILKHGSQPKKGGFQARIRRIFWRHFG